MLNLLAYLEGHRFLFIIPWNTRIETGNAGHIFSSPKEMRGQDGQV